MRGFFGCVGYYLLLGFSAHLFGERARRARFSPSSPRYRERNWEKSGRVYRFLRVAHWKDKLPDMSRVCRKMTPKALAGKTSVEKLERLIRETCVAERVHRLLIWFGQLGFFIWPGLGGVLTVCVWVVLGNVPYILIQRYNRPRLCALLRKLQRRDLIKGEHSYEALNLDVQHG